MNQHCVRWLEIWLATYCSSIVQSSAVFSSNCLFVDNNISYKKWKIWCSYRQWVLFSSDRAVFNWNCTRFTKHSKKYKFLHGWVGKIVWRVFSDQLWQLCLESNLSLASKAEKKVCELLGTTIVELPISWKSGFFQGVAKILTEINCLSAYPKNPFWNVSHSQ